MDLSIVVPVYNEVENVEDLFTQIHENAAALGRSYEVIVVDDGSTDGTTAKLRTLVTQYPHFKVIVFRRNYGQTAAMAAGFDEAQGEFVVTQDGDLQNDPKDYGLLLEKMTDDVDVVSGWRKKRKDKFISRRLPSMIANGLISKITGVSLHDYGCTLKAYRKEVVKNTKLYGEMHRFIPALASWVGRGVVEVPVNHRARMRGTSKYGISRTFRVVLDLMTVNFLLRYARGPIQIFGKFAAMCAVPGFLMLCFVLGANASYHLFGTEFGADLIKRPFWLTTSFMLIFFGIQLICMGLLGEIIIRTYYESQDKKIYHVKEVIGSHPTA